MDSTRSAYPLSTRSAGGVAPLDLHRLDSATQKALQDFLQQGESPNTRNSYRSAARYWLAWFELRYDRDFEEHADLPLPPEVVLQFIADHAERITEDGRTLRHELPDEVDRELVSAGVKAKPGPMALNTLEHRLSALARLHRDRKLDSPTDDVQVRRVLRAVRSAYSKRNQLPKKKDALRLEHLERLLATCDGTPAGVRDRALLLFAFDSGGRRRSEVAAADLSLLKKDGDGYSYHLAHSKTNQHGADRPEDKKPIVGVAAEAMRAWLQLLATHGLTSGPIFRRVRRAGAITREPLSDAGIWEIVKKRCQLAKLDAEGDFSPHSLRAGYMTEAAREKVPLEQAMAFSGHHDVKTALGYIRQEDMKQSAGAGLASRRRQPGQS